MAAVSLENVRKVFGGKRNSVVAVDRVTFRVADGEMVVLLGPSGCGKTTTLRLVAGLERLCGGTVRIADRVVNDVSPKDRDVAMVFQHYALYPHLSVRDNLAFGLRMRRTPKDDIRRRVADVAGLLQIEALLERKPHALSGGEQQRVALGRAIVRRPKVCLFDEPLANLDAQLRVRLRRELRRMQRELGMTALYVTHDQNEAMALADRIVLLKSGRVMQIGSPREVFERPANRFVAGFVGMPPMSFVNGRLSGQNGGVSFVCEGCRVRLSPGMADRVGDRVGQSMVMGVRSDRVSLVEASTDADRAIAVRVTMTEPAGNRQDVHTRMVDGQEIVVQAPMSMELSDGRGAMASIDQDGISLFEPGPEGANIVAVSHGEGAGGA